MTHPGQSLRAWRKSKGMTQEDLAAAVGIGPAYMSNLERGVSPNKRSGIPRASVELCKRFAKALDVPEADVLSLYGYAAPRPKPRTARDLIEELTELGIIDGILFNDIDIHDESPETFERVRHALEIALRVSLPK